MCCNRRGCMSLQPAHEPLTDGLRMGSTEESDIKKLFSVSRREAHTLLIYLITYSLHSAHAASLASHAWCNGYSRNRQREATRDWDGWLRSDTELLRAQFSHEEECHIEWWINVILLGTEERERGASWDSACLVCVFD